jgi:tetratricopeptide (TPR) repeat protein
VGTSRDPQANKEAITLLERAVSLDPSFAPARLELSQRSSVDHILAGGGEASFERATRAAERAVSLAPDLLPAAVNKVMLDANAGELVDAYRAATDLVRRRPGSGKAHFALSYVLRYAGAVRAAARECTVAESLDPSDPQLWSCFWTFVYTGELARAEAFVRTALPLHPQVALSTLGDLRMRKGDRAGALEMVAQAGSEITATDIQRGCLEQPRPAGLAKLVDDRESEYAGWRDSEGHYWYGALLADCGLPEAAFRALGRAVDTGYCSYPALDTDPAWSAVRSHPGFLALRARGVECRRRFLEATGVEDR